MHHKSIAYLMKAYHINEGRKASISAIVAEEQSDFTLYVTITEKSCVRYILTSGHQNFYNVGDTTEWINDTGRGHRTPAWNDCEMTIINVIHVDSKGTIVYNANYQYVAGAVATFVFK